jgi:hypothetical protein
MIEVQPIPASGWEYRESFDALREFIMRSMGIPPELVGGASCYSSVLAARDMLMRNLERRARRWHRKAKRTKRRVPHRACGKRLARKKKRRKLHQKGKQ